MVIIIPEQGQSITIHPGQQDVVILPPKQSSEAAAPAPFPWHDTTTTLKKQRTQATGLAKRIMPVVILSAVAFWGGRYLFPAYTNPAIEKQIIQKPGPGHPQLRSIMPAPADSPQKPAMQPPPEESPNSAFGLN